MNERNVKYLLKSYCWEKVPYSKLRLHGSFLGAPTHADIIEFWTFCWNLKIRGLRGKLFVDFLLFLFWKELQCFKVKEFMLLVEQ